MVKRYKFITLNILVILLLFMLFKTVNIKAVEIKLYDQAILFSQQEQNLLEIEANRISDEFQMDIVIVTTNDTNNKSARDYADDFYDENNVGIGNDHDGIMFLIDLDNREIYILKSGIGIQYLTDQRVDNIIDTVLSGGIQEENYYKAANAFLNETKNYLKAGIPVAKDPSLKVKNSLSALEGIISLIMGSGFASLFYFKTKAKYKMKNPIKPLLIKDNSNINLTKEEDILIDTQTTKRIIPRSDHKDTSNKSTTHTTTSGKTHGGAGAKF
ncbi:MAG: TPM domain-containing protein [Erysipelothrix sp.]|nr:TPM domain-containing protein [Erysipelothrix sp.]